MQLFIDGTFKSVPIGHHQLVVILAYNSLSHEF